MTLTYVPRKISHHKENTRMEYESTITCHSKVMANVKVFSRQTDRKTNDGTTPYAIDLSMHGHKFYELQVKQMSYTPLVSMFRALQ